MEAVTIPFEIQGVPESVRLAMDLAAACDKIASAADRATASLRQLSAVAARSASGWGKAAQAVAQYGAAASRLSGGSSAVVAPPRIVPLRGPAQALAAAQANYAAHGRAGGPAAFDAAHLLKQAQARFKSASALPPSGLAKGIQTAHSLLSGGGGAVAMARGALGKAGPWGMAADLVLQAFEAGAQRVMEALDRGTQKLALAFDSGSLESANKIGGLAGGLGFNAAEASAKFLENMGDGPLRVYAARIGINPYSSPYGGGNQDGAGSLHKFLTTYGDPTKSGDLEARMAARAAGMTQEIALARAASPETRKLLFAAKDDAFDPQTLKAAADAQIRMNLAQETFTRIGDRIASQLLPVLAEGLEALEPALKTFEQVIRDLTPWIKMQARQLSILIQGAKIVHDIQTGQFTQAKKDWDQLQKMLKNEDVANPAKKKEKEAAEKNLKAAEKFDRAVNEFKDGVYGPGAERARQAVPNLGPGYNDPAVRAAVNLGGVVF